MSQKHILLVDDENDIREVAEPPDLDGPATFRRLQADPQTSDIPVIFLTAKAHSAHQRRFAQLGAAGTLTKPFDPMTLTDQINAILTGSEET